MKRRIIYMLICLTALLCLTGCHGSKERPSFEVPEEFDSSAKYEITFWAKNDTNKYQTDIYEKAIRDFEALYPNITVNMRLYTDYSRIYNDVITNISTNTTPNVCITYPDHIATYIEGQGTVVELDELMADENYGLGGKRLTFDGPGKDELVEKFAEECRIGNKQYALPFMRSTEACYINKDYVERLGYKVPEVLTWDFIWEVSEAAMRKDVMDNFAVNGQNVLIPFIYKSTDNMLITMLRQEGGAYSTAEGDILLFNDKTKALLEEIALHGKTKAFSTFKISSYPANFLNAGQCLFAIDSTAGSTWMGSEAPLLDISEDKLVKFETLVRPVPQFNVAEPRMISQGPSMCIFNKEDPQEVLASWLFMQYLLTNDVQIAYSETEGYVPVTNKALNSAEYQDYLSREGEDGRDHYRVKLQAVKLLLNNIDNTFVTPVFNGSASLREASGQMIEEVTKAVRRKKEVDSAFIDSLYGDMISLYRLNNVVMGEDAEAFTGEGAVNGGDEGWSTLPGMAKGLIITLVLVWIGIGLFTIRRKIMLPK